jgi:restriction system protein
VPEQLKFRLLISSVLLIATALFVAALVLPEMRYQTLAEAWGVGAAGVAVCLILEWGGEDLREEIWLRHHKKCLESALTVIPSFAAYIPRNVHELPISDSFHTIITLAIIVSVLVILMQFAPEIMGMIDHAYEKPRLAESGMANVDQMSGKAFEKYLEALFKKQGYKVERTKHIGDYGADLVTAKDGVKIVIQAKRYKGKVGVKEIREAVAAKGYYDCSKAMVVTNSFYTRQAIELAKKDQVELWDRSKLSAALLSVKEKKATVIILDVVRSNKAAASAANQCLKGMPRDACALCGKPVSEKALQYCLEHPERFSGKVYCYEHQRGV